MKKLKTISSIFLFLKHTSLIIAALLNVVGLYLMLLDSPHWDGFISSSIFVLGSTIVLSFIAKFFEVKLYNQSLELYLESEDMKEAEIIRKGDDSVLIKNEDSYFTVYIDRLKNGFGYVMAPAEVVLEGKVVNLDKSTEVKKVRYSPEWSAFSWEDMGKEVKDEKSDSNTDE